MKSRTVIILWVTTILLGIVTYTVAFKNNTQAIQNTQLKAGDPLLEKLPITEAARITISRGDQSTDLKRLSDDIQRPHWGVANRANHTINYNLLRNLLGTLNSIKIAQSYPCQSSHYNRFGLSESAPSHGSSLDQETGTHITIFDQHNTKLAEVFLGKFSGNNQAMGRFIRVVGDDSGVYSIRERFPGITADPKDWLDHQFFKVNDIKSIAVTAPNDQTFTPWKLVKKLKPDGNPTANGQITLEGMAANEIIKLTSTNAFIKLFHSPRFIDVISKQQAQKTSKLDGKLKRTATIHTEDGISYRVHCWPEATSDPQDPKYLLSLEVTDLSPLGSEQSVNPQKQAKLKAASKFQGQVYLVSRPTVAPLLKERGDFIVTLPSGKAKSSHSQ